jgi:hypothetical protein
VDAIAHLGHIAGMSMLRRDPVGAWPPAPSPSSPKDEIAVQLHALENSLASLRLRLGVMTVANPRSSEDENFVAIARIADDAMEEARALRAAISKPRPRRA